MQTAYVFQKTVGDAMDETGRAVLQTSDDCYVIAGGTSSYGAGNNQPYLIKLRPNGDTVWTRRAQTYMTAIATCISQLSTGGFVIGGASSSFSAPIFPPTYGFLNTTDSIGQKLLDKSFAFYGKETVFSAVLPAAGGGFFCGGTSIPMGKPDTCKMLAVKISAAGDSVWVKTIGQGYDGIIGSTGTLTADGGFCIAGNKEALAIVGGGIPPNNLYVVKFNGSGDTVWTKSIGYPLYSHGYSIALTSDQGFIIAGDAATTSPPDTSAYVVKLTSTGATQWTQRLRTASGSCHGRSVRQTADGGYIITGFTNVNTANGLDVYLARLDASGTTQWSTTFGGAKNDIGYGVTAAHDGGFIVVGETSSYGQGKNDMYIIKTDAQGKTGPAPK